MCVAELRRAALRVSPTSGFRNFLEPLRVSRGAVGQAVCQWCLLEVFSAVALSLVLQLNEWLTHSTLSVTCSSLIKDTQVLPLRAAEPKCKHILKQNDPHKYCQGSRHKAFATFMNISCFQFLESKWPSPRCSAVPPQGMCCQPDHLKANVAGNFAASLKVVCTSTEK